MSGLFDFDNGKKDDKYSKGTRTPQYIPTMDRAPEVQSLFDKEKAVKLINHINSYLSEGKITQEEAEYLKLAAYRHVRIRYDLSAEYYCHASKEMQELMEESALVILDVNDAIANGYVQLSKTINDIVDEGKKIFEERQNG